MVPVGALLLAACGPGGDATNETSGSGAESAEPADLGAEFAAAFASSTTLTDGAAFDGAALAGTDAVLWFWAPWCTICRGEAPEIAEVAEKFAGQVPIVGVAGRGELDAMNDFISDTGTESLIQLADLNGDTWSAFGIFGQPAFVFIDDTGDVEVFVGSMSSNNLTDRIDELIAT